MTKEQIAKPFSTHEDTLKEMYIVDGFTSLMESLIECCRREITDNVIIDIESLRARQGELYSYKKLLARSKQAYENIKVNKHATKKGK